MECNESHQSNKNKLFTYDATYLGTVGITFPLHTFELLAHTAFLNLTLRLLLRIFEVTPVTELHQVTRFVDLTLESAKSRLNGFTITNLDRDFDSKGGFRGCCTEERDVK